MTPPLGMRMRYTIQLGYRRSLLPSGTLSIWLASVVALLVSFSAAADDAVEAVRLGLAKLLPGSEPDSIKPSAIPDLYEVVLGPHVVYVSADGRYLIQGDMLDIDNRENLTEHKRAASRLAAIEKMGESTMIVFAPEQVKHTVTVFTDVDCPYCVKLHSEVPDLNRLGIKVRYLAFPRAGLRSESYQKMVSVWCASDARQAITDAKFGKPVKSATCDNPVAAHYSLGQLIGVSGT